MAAKQRANVAQGDLFAAFESSGNDAPLPRPACFPADWASVVGGECLQPHFGQLTDFVAMERETQAIFPPVADVYNAFTATPWTSLRVVLLGQDPYPTPGQGHGLAFSVRPGVKLPASLRNIYQELSDDLGISPANHGHLLPWANRGVLLLNAVLTVRSGMPASHAGKGWETFTDAVLKAVSARTDPVVFLLWGGYAQKKAKLIDAAKHVVIASAHPSPLSARHGFFGSKPFSKINAALATLGRPPIDWTLPETESGTSFPPAGPR